VKSMLRHISNKASSTLEVLQSLVEIIFFVSAGLIIILTILVKLPFTRAESKISKEK
jgi:hypothetical protein